MDKPDTSHLFDAKMDLQPEEESFAQPTIILRNKTPSRCNVVRLAAIVVLVGLVVAAFIAGYMVRRTVSKCKKNEDVSPTSTPAPSRIRLQDVLAEMSAENIERNLRFVLVLIVSVSLRWFLRDESYRCIFLNLSLKFSTKHCFEKKTKKR